MICVIALAVFGILGIFSARYRGIAKEALSCVFRRVTFRKCTSGLDARLRSQISGRLMRKSPRMAGLVYRHFELLAWLFTIVMVLSFAYSGISVYNYAVYGNCNGRSNGEGFCIFDPAGNTKFSTFATNYSGPVVMPDEGNSPAVGSKSAPVLIIEFGCYRCSYTKRAEATVNQILQHYPDSVRYVYRDFPLEARHADANIHSEAARCAADQGMFWEYHSLLFERQNMTEHNATLRGLAVGLGLNASQFNMCLDFQQHLPGVLADFEAGVMAGVYGTPTFFINNRTLVGPRPFSEFREIIDEELEKLGIKAGKAVTETAGEPEEAVEPGGSCAA